MKLYYPVIFLKEDDGRYLVSFSDVPEAITCGNDFENIVGIHDITEELHSAYTKSKNFVAELTMLSNKYYHDIIESGVINDK